LPGQSDPAPAPEVFGFLHDLTARRSAGACGRVGGRSCIAGSASRSSGFAPAIGIAAGHAVQLAAHFRKAGEWLRAGYYLRQASARAEAPSPGVSRRPCPPKPCFSGRRGDLVSRQGAAGLVVRAHRELVRGRQRPEDPQPA
jgi:hypothetical protein